MKKYIGLLLAILVVWNLALTGGAQEGENVVVDEGLYFIHVESDNHYVMNVNGNRTDEGTNVDIMQNNNLDCQKFQVVELRDGYYRIVALSNGLDLTIADNSAEKEANLQLSSWTEGDNQKWRFQYAAEDRYLIQSALGTYIDNYGGNLVDGNNVWMYERNGSATQMWMLTEAQPLEGASNNEKKDENTPTEILADTVKSFVGKPGEVIEIPDGTYCINVEANNTYVLDVNGNYMDDGTTIDIMPNVNADCQKFIIEKQSDGYYTIKAKSSGKVLDVANGSSEPETDLQQKTFDGSDGQKWEFIYVDENRIKIRSALGTYVDNYAGNVADANNVWMYGETDGSSQLWMLTEVLTVFPESAPVSVEVPAATPEHFEGIVGDEVEIPDGVYFFNVEADNSYVMNVNGNYTEEGTTIDIMPNVNADCQKFRIEKQSDGYYSIIAMNSGLSLDVAGGSGEPEADLQQRIYDGSSRQKWKFLYVDETRIKVQSALGTYIDNYAGNVTDANNVWMYGESDSASQIWMLTKVVTEGVSEEGIEEGSANIEYVMPSEDNTIPDGIYTFVLAEDEKRCLTVSKGSDENGADIVLTEYDGNAYQIFEVINTENNQCCIISCGSEKALDIDGGSMVEGARVQQWAFDGTSGQLWSFEAGDDGAVTIVSKLGTVVGQTEESLEMSEDKPVALKILAAEVQK